MIVIIEHKITTKLYESSTIQIYRGIAQYDNTPVILKVLKPGQSTSEQLVRFTQEYDILRRIDAEGVIKVYGLENHELGLAIILEDFNGLSLAEHLKERKFDVDQFLPLAIKISQALEQIHQHQIIHKDINPANILWNPDSDQLRFIDFGLASLQNNAQRVKPPPAALEGTLDYISPEQTGRMNRPIDFRSDLYSLGITFYEVLMGHPPFQNSDPLALIHQHLAKNPVPPHKLNPNCPEILSKIIMKLLAKNADDRYQSAFGLKNDLEQCLTFVSDNDFGSSTSKINFRLGQQDFMGKLIVPDRLYGREREVQALKQIFVQSYASTDPEAQPTKFILVTGYAGMGKSALVNKVSEMIIEHQGLFVSGKFDNWQRNIPYQGWTQALTMLVNQLLLGTVHEVAHWQRVISQALGENGKVLTDIVQNLSLIIGDQPDVPELGPIETHHRLNLVLKRFIQAIAQPEHPLVIFLDNLHWSDMVSLSSLRALMVDTELQNLHIIGAYRDNEIDPMHPLITSLDAIREDQIPIHTINLTGLQVPDLHQMLLNTLHVPGQVIEVTDITNLTALIHEKTKGNPFFVRQFLKLLTGEMLLSFDTKESHWRWDIQGIQELDVTDNVVDLMTSRIHKLPVEVQHDLKIAACLGDDFDIPTLTAVTGQIPSATLTHLEQALADGLIILLSDIAPSTATSNFTPPTYTFAHDRIRQTIYTLIPKKEKRKLHLKIGQLLLDRTDEAALSDQIFTITNHWNWGESLLENQADRCQFIKLNLLAGQKAKATGSFESARQYLQRSHNLLSDSEISDITWETEYELVLAVKTELAEAAYLTSEYDLAESLVEDVLSQALDVLDKVKAYGTRIELFNVQHKYDEAISSSLEILQELGIYLSREPSNRQILMSLMQTCAVLKFGRWYKESFNGWLRALFRRGKQVQHLAQLPPMQEPYKRAASRILSKLAPATYFSAPQLVPLVISTSLRLNIKYGRTPESPSAYIGFGMLMFVIVGWVETAYGFGQLALNTLEQTKEKNIRVIALVTYHNLILPWKFPWRDTLQPFLNAYQLGLETGELEYANYAINSYISTSFHVGQALPTLEHAITKYQALGDNLKQIGYYESLQNYRQAIQILLKPGEQIPASINTLDILSPSSTRVLDTLIKGAAILLKLNLHYLFHNYQQALQAATELQQYQQSFLGQPVLAVIYFYDSLTRLAIYPDVPPKKQKEIRKKVAQNQKILKKWAASAPMNFMHKYHLVEAEKNRVLGRMKKASAYYTQAYSLALENEYVNEAALISELTGKFHLTQKRSDLAEFYLYKARNLYQQWGAEAKVVNVEAEYPRFFAQSQHTIGSSNSATSSIKAVDLGSVLKTSQAISGEIELEALLEKLINIVIENAGAQRGMLLLHKEGQWVVEAVGTVDDPSVTIMQPGLININDDSGQMLPKSVINYVARTQESIVLAEACHKGRFTHDAYVQINGCQSILCMPLIKQGKLTALLYLENNLMSGAFTTERLELLNLLSAQMATAIEHATIYRNLTISEERYRALFENSKDAISITTSTGEFLELNQAGLELLNIPPESISNLNIKDFYANQDERLRLLALLNEHGAVKDFELRMRKLDGAEIDILLTATQSWEQDGMPLSVHAIARDITARKWAEEELRRARDELEVRVQERTTALAKTNTILQEQIIERQQAEEAVRRRNTYLAALHETTLGLISQLDLRELLETLVHRAQELVEASRAIIFMVNPVTQTAEFSVVAGGYLTESQPLTYGQGIPGKAWQTMKTVVVDHYPTWAERTELGETLLIKAGVAMPLLQNVDDGKNKQQVVGILALSHTLASARRFNDQDIELLNHFAQLAALAIQNARLFESEQHQRQMAESLRQVATVLNSSLDHDSVVNKIVDQLGQVVNYDGAGVLLQDGEDLLVAGGNIISAKHLGQRLSLAIPSPATRVFHEKKPLIIADVHAEFGWNPWNEEGKAIRGWMGAPLIVGDNIIGILTTDSFSIDVFRKEDSEVLQIFANQAAIAIENARLYEQLQTAKDDLELRVEKRTSELVEANKMLRQEIVEREQMELALKQARDGLEIRVAERTQELSQVNANLQEQIVERNRAEAAIRRQNAYLATLYDTTLGLISHLDLDDLLKNMVLQAKQLLGATDGFLFLTEQGAAEMNRKVYDGPERLGAIKRLKKGQGLSGRVWETGQPIVIDDYKRWAGRLPKRGQYKHTCRGPSVGVPLLQQSKLDTQTKPNVIGVLGLSNLAGGKNFGEEEVKILSQFAQLASLAIENAQLFESEHRQRQMAETLRQVAAVLNYSLDHRTVLRRIVEQLGQIIKHDGASLFLLEEDALVLVGDPNPDSQHIGCKILLTSQNPAVRSLNEEIPLIISDVRTDPHWQAWPGREQIRSWMGAPLSVAKKVIGILTVNNYEVNAYQEVDLQTLQIFADQAAIAIENARLYEALSERTIAIQDKNEALETTLQLLYDTQNQLVIQEKLASLGALTAGIAHEIKNPLNFINNFARLIPKQLEGLDGEINMLIERSDLEMSQKIDRLLKNLTQLAAKIDHHGQTVNSIVQGMLLHSRGGTGQRELIDLNDMLNKHLQLAYHGMRAKYSDFNVTVETDFDKTVGKVSFIPQEMSRVFLNVMSNACYAAYKKNKLNVNKDPTIWIRTENLGGQVKIYIRDNGSGISSEVLGKIFTPFFTTKPTNEGTGLGLSISHDIVVQGHQGEMRVETEVGQWTEFVIVLPREQRSEEK